MTRFLFAPRHSRAIALATDRHLTDNLSFSRLVSNAPTHPFGSTSVQDAFPAPRRYVRVEFSNNKIYPLPGLAWQLAAF
jgi:hypothetical protein